jgi:hypothetical protein
MVDLQKATRLRRAVRDADMALEAVAVGTRQSARTEVQRLRSIILTIYPCETPHLRQATNAHLSDEVSARMAGGIWT